MGVRLYWAFRSAAAAHARWEPETSRTILGDKRKLLLLGLMLVLIGLGSVVFAEDLPSILSGKKACSPAF